MKKWWTFCLAALAVTSVVAAETSADKAKAEEKPKWSCSMTVSPRPGESKVTKSGGSGLRGCCCKMRSSSSSSNNSSTSITRNMKWLAELRFRDAQPEKVEIKSYYIATDGRGGYHQIGKEDVKKPELDKNGRAAVELVSPTTRMTKSHVTTSSCGSGGFTSSNSVMRGERVTGCVVQLFADGKLAKSWASDSRWDSAAKKVPFSMAELNQKKSSIGLR